MPHTSKSLLAPMFLCNCVETVYPLIFRVNFAYLCVDGLWLHGAVSYSLFRGSISFPHTRRSLCRRCAASREPSVSDFSVRIHTARSTIPILPSLLTGNPRLKEENKTNIWIKPTAIDQAFVSGKVSVSVCKEAKRKEPKTGACFVYRNPRHWIQPKFPVLIAFIQLEHNVFHKWATNRSSTSLWMTETVCKERWSPDKQCRSGIVSSNIHSVFWASICDFTKFRPHEIANIFQNMKRGRREIEQIILSADRGIASWVLKGQDTLVQPQLR